MLAKYNDLMEFLLKTKAEEGDEMCGILTTVDTMYLQAMKPAVLTPDHVIECLRHPCNAKVKWR